MNGTISPIRKYQMEYCLRCEEQGKCDYEKTEVCIAARLFYLKLAQLSGNYDPDDRVDMPKFLSLADVCREDSLMSPEEAAYLEREQRRDLGLE